MSLRLLIAIVLVTLHVFTYAASPCSEFESVFDLMHQRALLLKDVAANKYNASPQQNIFDAILLAVKESKTPISTTDISKKINKSWHTVDRHCLKLQLMEKINGFKVGNMNLWTLKK